MGTRVSRGAKYRANLKYYFKLVKRSDVDRRLDKYQRFSVTSFSPGERALPRRGIYDKIYS